MARLEEEKQQQRDHQLKLQELKRNRPIKKFGRKNMNQSEKPELIQKVIVKKLDDNTIDQLTYLGWDFQINDLDIDVNEQIDE